MAGSSKFSIAVHVLTLLATTAEEENLKSESMACSVNTNAVVIRRLLCDLSKAKLVISQKGSCGGTKLAKKPEEISLIEVYRAVESGTLFSLHRRRPNARCHVGKHIEAVMENLQTEVDNAITNALEKYTLDDVIDTIERARKSSRLVKKAKPARV
jgi:Rrf2 family protein